MRYIFVQFVIVNEDIKSDFSFPYIFIDTKNKVTIYPPFSNVLLIIYI